MEDLLAYMYAKDIVDTFRATANHCNNSTLIIAVEESLMKFLQDVENRQRERERLGIVSVHSTDSIQGTVQG